MKRPLSQRRYHEWPKDEGPRERLLGSGPESLSDAELLAIFLQSGTAGRSAVDVARSLLLEFGSLRELLNADRERCLRQRGLGPARYTLLRAALELARRHHLHALRSGPALARPADTRSFLLAQLRDRPYEVFCCLHLNAQLRLIAFEELFRGTVDHASVHPREVLRQALAHNAAAVILAHNHPSGQAVASEADREITQRVCDSLALVDIRVVDHLVVGDGECTSFVENGWL